MPRSDNETMTQTRIAALLELQQGNETVTQSKPLGLYSGILIKNTKKKSVSFLEHR